MTQNTHDHSKREEREHSEEILHQSTTKNCRAHLGRQGRHNTVGFFSTAFIAGTPRCCYGDPGNPGRSAYMHPSTGKGFVSSWDRLNRCHLISMYPLGRGWQGLHLRWCCLWQWHTGNRRHLRVGFLHLPLFCLIIWCWTRSGQICPSATAPVLGRSSSVTALPIIGLPYHLQAPCLRLVCAWGKLPISGYRGSVWLQLPIDLGRTLNFSKRPAKYWEMCHLWQQSWPDIPQPCIWHDLS